MKLAHFHLMMEKSSVEVGFFQRGDAVIAPYGMPHKYQF
jgi:hypothetical protein